MVYTSDYRKLSILQPLEISGLPKGYRCSHVIESWQHRVDGIEANPLHVQLDSLWTKMKLQSHINQIEISPL